jgi:hypothetical protein
MALTWASFSEARGEDGLVHVVKHADKDALCGVRVQAGDVGGTGVARSAGASGARPSSRARAHDPE